MFYFLSQFSLALSTLVRYTSPVNTLASNSPLVRRKDRNGRFRTIPHRRISFVSVGLGSDSRANDSVEETASVLHERRVRRDRRPAFFILAARLSLFLGRLAFDRGLSAARSLGFL